MTFRIIFYSLFSWARSPLLRLRRGDFVFFAFIFGWWLSLAATLRRLARFNGFFVVMRTLL